MKFPSFLLTALFVSVLIPGACGQQESAKSTEDQKELSLQQEQKAPPREEKPTSSSQPSETTPLQQTGTEQNPQKHGFAHDSSDLKPDNRITYGRLNNGMRYALIHSENPKQTASLRLRFDTGSLNEAEDQRGLAHFLEHMAFNGSENIPEEEMVKMLERLGLSFGADSNAYTDFEETVYMLEIPETNDELLDTALMIMRETAGRLTLKDEAIDRERGVVLSEERARNSPFMEAFRNKLSFLYPKTSLSERFPIGVEPVLKNAQRDTFLDYYMHYYTPKRAFLVIAGDIDVKAVEHKIKNVFGDWEAKGEREDRDRGTIEPRPLEAGFFYHPEILNEVGLYSLKPFTEKQDNIQERQKSLLRDLGFAILNQRFLTLLRQPDSPFREAGAGFAEQFGLFEEASVVVIPSDPGQWRAALILAEQELRRALEHGFLESELKEQIARFEKGLKDQAESAQTRKNTGLASQIMIAFAQNLVMADPADLLKSFEDFKDKITPQTVHKAFLDAWSGPERLFYVQSSKDKDITEEVILETYRNSLAQDIRPLQKAEAKPFAYQDFGKAGSVKERKEIKDLSVTEVVFENNVRLNLKKTDFERGKVYVQVNLGEGLLSMPKDKPGLNIFASEGGLTNGGLQAHSMDEVERIMAGKTVETSFHVGDDRFSFNALTTPDNLKDQLSLIAAYLKEPGWRPEALEQFKKTVKVDFAAYDVFPGWYVNAQADRLVRSGDPRFGVPQENILLNLTMEDLKAWLGPVLAKGAIEISIVGDLDIEKTIEAVAENLGALPGRQENFMINPEARKLVFPRGGGEPVILHHKGEKDTTLSLIYWPVPDWKGDVRIARKLSLFSDIFGRELLEVVREKEGGSYSPGAGISLSEAFPDYGFIMAYMNPKPQKIDHFYNVVFDIAQNMRDGHITEDAYQRALKPVLEHIENNLSQNTYWVEHLGRAQSEPGSLDDAFRRVRKDFESITLDDIKAFAKTLLEKQKAYRISILPPKETPQDK